MLEFVQNLYICKVHIHARSKSGLWQWYKAVFFTANWNVYQRISRVHNYL